MGNSASNSHANVRIALERPQYHAGEVLDGYVEVSVSSEFTCSDLFVRFYGDVRTTVHWEERKEHRETVNGETRTRTETIHHTAHGHECVVQERRLVAQFPNGRVSPGLYQFPFKFALHAMLPSSCFVSGHDHAALVYGVEVQLHRPNIFKHDLVHRAQFDVIAHVPHPITPAMTLDRQNVNCCCCFNRGAVSLGARLERNAFIASDAVVVVWQIENASRVEVQRIHIALKESIRFRAEGHSSHKAITLAELSLAAVPAGGGFGDWNGTSHQVSQLILPPMFQHCTLSTRLLQVSHTVEVCARMPFGINNPCISLPVTLHRSPLVVPASAPLPHPADSDLPQGPTVPYSPNAAALGSPVPIDMTPSAPQAPQLEQALQALPQMSMQPAVQDPRALAAQQAVMAAPMQAPLMAEFPAAFAGASAPVGGGPVGWNPNAMCDGTRAEDRVLWLQQNKGLTIDAARGQVMREFPIAFAGTCTPVGGVPVGWNPNAICDGTRAEERVLWLQQNKGLTTDAARSQVMREFPAAFAVG